MSVSTQATFETGHTDQIHDCQYDYYGRVRAIRARRAERGGRRTRTASRFEPRDDQRSVCYPDHPSSIIRRKESLKKPLTDLQKKPSVPSSFDLRDHPNSLARGDVFVRPHDQGVRRLRRLADVSREPDRPRRPGVDVRVGAPQVRRLACVVRIRQQGDRLARSREPARGVLAGVRVAGVPARGVRERPRVGAARARPRARLRLLGRLGVRADAPPGWELGSGEDSQRALHRMHGRVVVPGAAAGKPSGGRRRGRACREAPGDQRVRQPGEDLAARRRVRRVARGARRARTATGCGTRAGA